MNFHKKKTPRKTLGAEIQISLFSFVFLESVTFNNNAAMTPQKIQIATNTNGFETP